MRVQMAVQLDLLRRLKQETVTFSMATMWQKNLPIFKTVIREGEVIIPAIIFDLIKNGPNWVLFDALNKISQTPITILPKDVGIAERVKESWLKWAQENNYAFSCCDQALVWEKISDDRKDDYLLEGCYCSVCLTVRERKNGQTIYAQKEGGYVCAVCETKIVEVEILHSIQDIPGAAPGHGHVHIETVPYCPKCENKPNPSGRIIIS